MNILEIHVVKFNSVLLLSQCCRLRFGWMRSLLGVVKGLPKPQKLVSLPSEQERWDKGAGNEVQESRLSSLQ